MKIVWDEPKRRATLAARGLDFAMVTTAFFDHGKITVAKRGRFMALGFIAGQAYAVVFRTLGSEGVSIVSLRRASRKEKSVL